MRSISRLLIANRGEIAARIMRTAKAMDISCVVVYSDADTDAPFVRLADEAVRLPGSAPTETYLRSERIIDAARLTDADAIHPGYGFLAEDAKFARACADAGLIFVGPSAHAIETMGAKIPAKRAMAAAGVPVLPHIEIGCEAEAAATPPTALANRDVGFPVLVKAAFGGGGRGMRLVREAAELGSAVAAAQREAASSFGDGTVFAERYVERARHVEVQIVGDAFGKVVELGERDCSVQRRYQKLIEESPSPIVDTLLRERLGDAAVAAGRAVDYVGAGTVEFVVDRNGQFFFLEMNTRLQVEHPVTELVTGLDLVWLQLQVAEGRPLPPEVDGVQVRGHAIEARLYAEDVAAGFLPATGVLHGFSVPESPGVRVDSGVAVGSRVSSHYDSLLAKVIAHASSREEACRLLARALSDTYIHGVATNRDLLVALLRSPDYRAGDVDVDYLGRHDPVELMRSARAPDVDRIHALVAARADHAERRQHARVLAAAPSGWRNVPSEPQWTTYSAGGAAYHVGYRFTRRGLEAATVNQESFGDVEMIHVASDVVDLAVDGVRRTFRIGRGGGSTQVHSSLGATTFVELPRFAEPEVFSVPGSLVAPMPGTVVRVDVRPGDDIQLGAPVVVLEAMKMQHTVVAPAAGTVTGVGVEAGQTVDAGAVLAVVEYSSS
jgi:acetyl/propionyl-CoA carboxylase alpha subunit